MTPAQKYRSTPAGREKARLAAAKHRRENPEKVRRFGRASTRRRNGWAPGEHEKAETALLRVEACACCGAADSGNGRAWAADHNHTTGMFRGHVCYACNTMIGLVEKRGLDLSPQ